MTTTVKPISAAEALRELGARPNLDDVCMKLADTNEGPGYNQAHIDLMVGEYRKFLALQLAHPEAPIVPCGIVDEIWHRHILDTAAYRRDSEAIFGRFLDHYPYFGMRSAVEAEELNDAYAETLGLYRDAFGEPPPETWVSTDPARCRKPTCRR
jgi:hypothetical protein